MKFRITHRTEYDYKEAASLCYNEARLKPRSFETPLLAQEVHDSHIKVKPAWTDYRERTDFYGNDVLYFTLRQPHTVMEITATSDVTLTPKIEGQPPQFESRVAQTPWEQVRDSLKTALDPASLEARQFVMESPKVPISLALAAYAAPSFSAGRPILEAVHDLMTRIYTEFDFVPGVTTIATPISEVLEQRRGVCQDFAHVMLGCLRAQQLAARYMSGYIETLPPPGEEKLEGADASHAWCAIYVPRLGWVDFDPTNNLMPKDQHITLAWGRDFADVTPLKGVFFSNGEHKLKVAVDVARVG